MRCALILLAVALLLTTLAPAGARTAETNAVFLPLIGNEAPPGGALPPERLGTPLPVSTNQPAFFADQIAEPGGVLAFWAPPGWKVLRGILFANGTPNRPSPSETASRNEAAQQRILALRQLASLWGFALVTGGVLELAQPAQYLDGALQHWATTLGHPELAYAPLAIEGTARYGGFCRNEAARLFKGRLLACSVVVAGAGPTTDENRDIPTLVVVGELDRGQSIISSSVLPARQAGSLIAGAMMWDVDRRCERCQDLTWPYLDRVIQLRLPPDANPRAGPVALRELFEAEGHLGSMSWWTGPWASAEVPADPHNLAWLPDLATARIWRAFVVETPRLGMVAPTSSYRWGAGFAQVPSSLRATESLTLEATISRPIAGSLTFYDGDQPLGVGTPSLDGSRLTLGNVRLKPGMHSLFVMSETGPVSWPAGLIVLP